MPAHTKLFEQIFCQQYFRQHDPSLIPISGLIPEDQCKNPAIQRQIATLRGWYQTFDAAPALIMSIPAGIIIDIIGRRPVLLAGLCTITIQQFWIAFICSLNGSVPLQAIWLAPFLNFIGGGMVVMNLTFICVICDITSKDTLAVSIFRLTAVGELCKVLGPFIAGALMQYNAWWAMITGLSGLILMIIIAFFVPETLAKQPPSDPSIDPTSPPQSRFAHFRNLVTTGIRDLSIVWTDRRLIILCALFPLLSFGGTLSDVLQQYISVRYNWSLANAAFIFSLQGMAASISLSILLPLFTAYLAKRLQSQSFSNLAPPSTPEEPSATPTILNAIIFRASLVIAAIAWAIQGFAPSIPLLLIGVALETLGSGAAGALQALAASLVETKDNGRVFSVITVAGVLSTVVAHPLTAVMFSEGMDKGGGIWLGIPFFVSAIGAAVAAVILCFVKFDRREAGGIRL